MKAVGFLLLIAGFLAGAYATALDTEHTDWTLFLPAAVVAAIGVMMVKRATQGASRSQEVLDANRGELTDSLNNIVATLDVLQGSEKLEGDALRDAIDSRLRDDLRRFADARESMVHLFGLQTYANIMSEFAAGERYINRVWSASADGYTEEARDYLGRASGQFRHAREQLLAVSG